MVTFAPVAAPIPSDEPERLADLRAYNILDSDPEPEFDAIARLAALVCGTPMARVNFVDRDRQWTKATYAMERDETPREVAFCSHTIVTPDGWMVVEDALEDPRFSRNPLVLDDPHIRFYAGATIESRDRRPLGSVCVIDSRPRSIGDEQRHALEELSRLGTTQLELRRLLADERRLVEDLRDLDRQRAEFTAAVAHDFRTPLTSIKGYAELLRHGAIEPAVALDTVDRAAERLLELVDDLGGTTTAPARDLVDVGSLVDAAVSLVRPAAEGKGVELSSHVARAEVVGDAHRLSQVIENLVGNAVKYTPHGSVAASVRTDGETVTLEVADTGVGIPRDELPRLFDRYYRASTSAAFAGTGLGLATVRAIVDAHGGSVQIESDVGRGTTVRVMLPAA